MPDPTATAAVILAGGIGARMGGPGPKQLLRIGGRSLLAHSIAAFAPHVDALVVVMASGHLGEARAALTEVGAEAVVVEGGATRGESTRRALAVLPRGAEGERVKVLVHDGVRPLVTDRIIEDCLAALDEADVVTAAVPSADTIALADGEEGSRRVVREYLPRHRLVRVQTPQGFRLGPLRAAHEQAAALGLDYTDDCQVVAARDPGAVITLVPGDDRNLKVTRPVDLAIAEALLAP